MRIGLDASALLHPMAGFGRHLHELASAIPRVAPLVESRLFFRVGGVEERLFAEETVRALEAGEATRAAVVRVPRVLEFLTGGLLPLWRERAVFRRERIDVLLAPATRGRFDPGFCTVLVVRDLSWRLLPGTLDDSRRRALERRVPGDVLRSNAVVVSTPGMKEEVLRHLPISAKRVAVIPPGVRAGLRRVGEEETRASRARLGLPERYLLHLGTIHPRKNGEGLLRALDRLVSDGRLAGVHLVFAGPGGPGAERLDAEVRRLGLQERVHLPGFVAEEDLPALFSGAIAFLYPSLHPATGVTLLEAMACGVPVVSSTAGSLPDLVGDAALLVDARDDRGWAEAMARIAEDAELREVLARRGPVRAAPFTWEECARKHVELFERLLREEPGGRVP